MQALSQFGKRWSLCDFLDLGQQIVRERHAGHGSASLEAPVQGIGYITKLNHLGHATSILSCSAHVNGIAFAHVGSSFSELKTWVGTRAKSTAALVFVDEKTLPRKWFGLEQTGKRDRGLGRDESSLFLAPPMKEGLQAFPIEDTNLGSFQLTCQTVLTQGDESSKG
jgi:hypothetical protein